MPTDSNIGPKGTDSDTPSLPRHGVLVRARNGDVIRYDSSGVIMRLADRVIEDIAMRLEGRFSAALSSGAAVESTSPDGDDDKLHLLENIDAWNLRNHGNTLRFTARLPGRQGVRDFRLDSGSAEIVADAPGQLLGILGIGGPRAALATPEEAGFPFHILSPADDIGAVGVAGVERAARSDTLSRLREMTHEALVAETFLDWQMEKHAPLPLFVVRTETDNSATAGELAKGQALENFLIAAANLKHAADRLGKTAKVFAVTLDFALEDLGGSASSYRDAMLDLMKRIEKGLAETGFEKPIFVTRFDSGRTGNISDAVIEGQWELLWNHGEHNVIASAPGYMFEMDEYDRPTAESRRHMAVMTAAAIGAESASASDNNPLTRGWRCPVMHLAEIDAKAPLLRVVIRALSNLIVTPIEGLGFQEPIGFRLEGANAPTIKKVEVDPEDPQTLLVHLDRRPESGDLHLCYGYGEPDKGAARVAICDGWSLTAADGRILYRWAMPARLAVQAGGIAQ